MRQRRMLQNLTHRGVQPVPAPLILMSGFVARVGDTAISAKVVIPVALVGAIAAVGGGVYWWKQSHVAEQQWAVVEKYCVECHNKHKDSPKTDWQVGDVRGVLEIIRPLDKDEERVGDALRLALSLSAVVSALLLVGSMLLVWAGRKKKASGVA